MTVINGLDVDQLEGFKQLVTANPNEARQDERAAARWLGGDASHIECGSATVELGGDGNLNAMQALLAGLAACEIDVIATHAALAGLEIAGLEVEATGHFDMRSYLGLNGAPGPGYDGVTVRARLRAPDATPDQLDHLRKRCERSSPVGDTLVRSVPVTLELEAW